MRDTPDTVGPRALRCPRDIMDVRRSPRAAHANAQRPAPQLCENWESSAVLSSRGFCGKTHAVNMRRILEVYRCISATAQRAYKLADHGRERQTSDRACRGCRQRGDRLVSLSATARKSAHAFIVKIHINPTLGPVDTQPEGQGTKHFIRRCHNPSAPVRELQQQGGGALHRVGLVRWA